MLKPELLAPAGNLEKLKIAFLYGADAVYVGGHVFGLRRYADNFTLSQLQEGIQLANQQGKQVYVVLNGFAHQNDLDHLQSYLSELNQIQPHALIISDMGVFQLAKKLTTIPLHVSTQASVTNKYTCQFWKNEGAKRVILAREVSIGDCIDIKKFCDTELEIFIHGAMCASYSGKCVISNYAAGRDSNRGGCIQSCRHQYDIIDPASNDIEDSLHMMNAKDLMGVTQLPNIIKAGIDSIKIEGRMKSNLYVANIAQAYRTAIDMTYHALQQETPLPTYTEIEKALGQVSNRTFSTGGLTQRPGGESIHYQFDRYEKEVDYLGTVKAIDNAYIVLDVKHPFEVGNTVELMAPQNQTHSFTVECIYNSINQPIQKTKPNSVVRINKPENAAIYGILRKPIS